MGGEEQNLSRIVVTMAIYYHLHVSKKELTESHSSYLFQLFVRYK